MTLAPSDFQQVYNLASNKVKDQAKHRDETHEQFIARCWIESVRDMVEKNGYQLSGFDSSTDGTVLIRLPEFRR